MITALALINALARRDADAPPLSREAAEQVADYRAELDAAIVGTDGVKAPVCGILGPADFDGFADRVTSVPCVSIAQRGGALAVSHDGRHVDVVPAGANAQTRAEVERLLGETSTVGWGAPALPTGKDLRVTVTVLSHAGEIAGPVSTIDEALKAIGVPTAEPHSVELGLLVTDARAAHAIAAIVDERVEASNLEAIVGLEQQVDRLLRRATDHGLGVDAAAIRTLRDLVQGSFDHHDSILRSKIGVSVNSASSVLQEKLARIGSAVESTKTEDLEMLREDDLVVNELLKAREAQSLLSLVRPWDSAVAAGDDVVHPSFKTNGITGRVASMEPNVMGLPRDPRFRSIILARPGHVLLEADYSASQLRIIAGHLNVKALLDLFQRGEDVHAWAAARYHEVPASSVTPVQRAFGKLINLAPLYGIGERSLMDTARRSYRHPLRLHEAERIIGVFFAAYPELAAWHEREMQHPSLDVRTPLGRRLRLAPDRSYNSRLAAPIQAIEADALKTAMVNIASAVERRGARLVTPVNDALLYDVPEREAASLAVELQSAMVDAFAVALPGGVVSAEIELKSGISWAVMRSLPPR